MPPPEYIPGVCNIGDVEIKQRKRIGWIGLIFTVLIWLKLEALQIFGPWRLILFIPAAISATGFLQGLMHFCAGFGMQGVFNFGPKLYKTDTVSQAEFRAQDRKKAITILSYSILIGVAITTIAYLI